MLVLLATWASVVLNGMTVDLLYPRALGVSEGTYHRGRKPVRRAQAEDARWLMELERENLHAHAVSVADAELERLRSTNSPRAA